MKNNTIIFLLFLCVNSFVKAQRCGNELLFPSSGVKKETNQNKSLARANIPIPVVFHILWHDESENVNDALIFSQLEALNRDFNEQNEDIDKIPNEFKDKIGNVGIHFCLALKGDEIGIIRKQVTIPEFGTSDDLFYTNRGGSDAWDSDKYLNIWIVNTGTVIAGYGTYPLQTPPEKSGVVVHPKYFGINNHQKYGKGRIVVHEVGHYLGLKHPWGDDNNCETDDEIEDTPPQKKGYTGCPVYPKKGCSNSEMFMTFMDYVDDDCMYMFTKGQKERMIYTIENYRKGLMSANSFCTLNNSKKAYKFNLYPNPFNDFFTLFFEETYQDFVTIEIFDMLGKKVYSEKRFLQEKLLFTPSNLSKGLYFLKIKDQSIKLIKQ